MSNIAFNLLYNNGNEGIYVGFHGTCSIQNIIYNVRKGTGRWCSQPRCSCRKYFDRNFTGTIPDRPCNESYLFTDWEWNAGEEFETGIPFLIRQPVEGKVAILTTLFAGQPERERKIIGFFKIEDCVDDRTIIASHEYRLRLLREEANELNFWQYHRNNKGEGARWSSGRFRYLRDDQTAAILHDLKEIVRNEESQIIIRELLLNDFGEYGTVRPIVDGLLLSEAVMKMLLKRKYGGGGESRAHKDLKYHIANNPEFIGLGKSKMKARVEHPYISGDMVDILFEPDTGYDNTVVEIELDNVLPGIHQAIKYRALRCAQLGLGLDDTRVKATVVAWVISAAEADLCRKYGIAFYEVKV